MQNQIIPILKKLLSFNTINPPGNEDPCTRYIGEMLAEQGFATKYFEFAPARTSLVATLKGNGNAPAIAFSSHVDTVPLGGTEWQQHPFSGKIDGDKIYGRGTSDMKGAVAVMVANAMDAAQRNDRQGNLVLVITAGEENGCKGAEYLASLEDVLPKVAAMVIGEPTGNLPLIGHKGTLWIEAICKGKTAHGSMPHLGDNAIFKAMEAINRIRDFRFKESHPVMGKPTINIGMFQSGQNINSVPDEAIFTLDIRTVAGMKNEQVFSQIYNEIGELAKLKKVVNTESVVTDSNHPWVQRVFKTVQKELGGEIEPKTATYFTDAGALVPAMGNPATLIWGPGELEQAHMTDEFCYISKLEAAYRMYKETLIQWLHP